MKAVKKVLIGQVIFFFLTSVMTIAGEVIGFFVIFLDIFVKLNPGLTIKFDIHTPINLNEKTCSVFRSCN